MIAPGSGDGRRAAEWIVRAAAEPGAAPIWFNLFQAYDSAGEPERGWRAWIGR